MKAKYKILLVIAPAVFVIDQLTKLVLCSYVELGARIPVIPGFFDIVHFRNTGAAFGMLSGLREDIRVPFFYGIAVLAVILLAFFYRSLRDDERLMPVTLSLVFGGIAGNQLDRLLTGSVTDFLSFHIGNSMADFSILGKRFYFELEWPAFNAADSAITVAMFLLLYSAFCKKRCHPGIL